MTEGPGAALSLFPNLNTTDPVWRSLLRNVQFRRALSLAMDRDEINEVIYFGLANPSNNTVTPDSALWRRSYQTTWATYDPEKASDLMVLDSRGVWAVVEAFPMDAPWISLLKARAAFPRKRMCLN